MHRVNGIAKRVQQYLPNFPSVQETPTITKSKQRSVELVDDNDVAFYNAGERYVKVTSSEIETSA